jgi:hypothetical protein
MAKPHTFDESTDKLAELEQQASQMKDRIRDLEMENEELKRAKSEEKSLKIKDIVQEIHNFERTVQVRMLLVLRKLVADQDGNWIETLRAEEDRLSDMDDGTQETSKKRTLCLGAATDLLLILLKKANIASYADNTKMANLISLVTDYSKDKIRQRLSNCAPLARQHQPEVVAANRVLESLGIDDRLSLSNK